MDRLIELGRLADYYGAMLTEHQRRLVEAYVYEDLSLGEIAEGEGISRQAVRDGIVHAENKLREMEEKLGIIRSHDALTGVLDSLSALTGSLPEGEQKQAFAAGLSRAYGILEEENGI